MASSSTVRTASFSALAWRALERSLQPGEEGVFACTAHPAKFPAAVEEASGVHPPLPPAMSDLYERAERVTRVPNDLTAIEDLIRDRLRH